MTDAFFAIETEAGPLERPLVWSLTASDTAAGAGMQADVAVANRLGVQCQCVVLAITAQNHLGMQASWLVPLEQVQAQWQALRADGWPAVIRLGWLPEDAALFEWLLTVLADCPAQIVWDPVLKATAVNPAGAGTSDSGAAGLPEQMPGLRRRLLALVDIITPNESEARWLVGWGQTGQPLPLAEVADQLHKLGPSTVVITGGDSETPAQGYSDTGMPLVQDWVFHYPAEDCQQPEQQALSRFVIEHPRLEIAAHGSGCHFTAALAATLAKGERLYDSLLQAVNLASASLAAATRRPADYHNCFATAGPALTQAGIRVQPLRLETQPEEPETVVMPLVFPKLDRPLGMYGLVDNLDWLQQLLALGVDTLQWRVKQQGTDYRAETAAAIRLCEAAGVPLYINDDWQLALELNAWGVHLGQEDLATADLPALAAAGICLGISTHTEWEIIRARSLKPSYIAFGPVFPPLSKRLKYPPLGVARLSRWVAENSDFPLTCIGGITEQNAGVVLDSGINSVAIVTALMPDAGLPGRYEAIRQAFEPGW
ncbi:thiamine phosphate synthase [Oceanobacter mangrovi]|uniref:thiamine phosphate synthase n=1 Tax=Oceanobacter mangrovi TaxID=2862510 RepID=UPI001C8DCFB8|nr:thiamine phosphate synthase [Oceanobacter mangrovi]